MPLYVVDTIITYRMRYVVEAREESHALDEVTMKDSGREDDHFDEVTQKFLGETIVDSREISEKKFDKMLKDLETTIQGLLHSWRNGSGPLWLVSL